MSTQTPESDRGLDWRLFAAGCGIIAAIALRCAWSTLNSYFVGDDFAYVGRFMALPWREWPALFVRDWSGGIWGSVLPELRPFSALTFMLDSALWGTNPMGYHLTNFLLEVVCGWLVFLIAWQLLRGAWWQGVAAGLLFVTHPIHAEPVAWIVGRVDLTGTLCYLAGFFAAGRFLQSPDRISWAVIAWVAYWAGCFSKEFCLTMPLMLLSWAVICGRPTLRATPRQIAMLVVGFLVVVGIYAGCRRAAFGAGGTGPAVNFMDPGYLDHQMNYVRWLLLPAGDFLKQLERISRVEVGVIAVLAVAVMVFWRWRQPGSVAWRTAMCFGLGWYAIATLPLVVVTYFSPRHLHMASAGICIALTFLVSELARRRWLAQTILAVFLYFFVVRFDRAVTPWRKSAAVSKAAIETIASLQGTRPSGELLLVDIPDVYAGVWLWSWSASFAMRPPFISPLINPVIERPSLYISADLWQRQRDLTLPSKAPGALLIGVDEAHGGAITQLVVSAEKLRRASTLLTPPGFKPDGSDADKNWRQFVDVLKTP